MAGKTRTCSIVYDGPAFDTHEMDILALSSSLKGLGEAISEANTLLNGEASELEVKVKADLIAGSFGFDVIVQFLEGGKDIIDYLGLAGPVVGGATALEVLQKLRGRKIEVVESESGTEQVSLKVDGEEITCSKDVERIVNSPAIRKAFDRFIHAPLSADGADKFEVRTSRTDTVPLVTVTKDDGSSFKAKTKLFQDRVESDEFIANITFIAANIGSKSGWQIDYVGENKMVRIEDDSFRERLTQPDHPNIFGEMFEVKMVRKTTFRGEGGLVDEKLIIKQVLRHRAAKERRLM